VANYLPLCELLRHLFPQLEKTKLLMVATNTSYSSPQDTGPAALTAAVASQSEDNQFAVWLQSCIKFHVSVQLI